MSENALFELAAIVSFQFELLANLSFQEPEDEKIFSHPFELERAFLWQGYGFRRGEVMSKVSLINKRKQGESETRSSQEHDGG